MISQDDIDAFAEEAAPNIRAAAEFVRRRRKGIPSDRWASSRGLHHVADGIDDLFRLLAITTEALAELGEHIAARQRESMSCGEPEDAESSLER